MFSAFCCCVVVFNILVGNVVVGEDAGVGASGCGVVGSVVKNTVF